MDRLDTGGLNQLRAWIAGNPDAKLIVIDTLATVRGARRSTDTPYEGDYREVGALKALADATGVAIILVTHTRKAEADDPFDTVSGTLGLTGAADATIILSRDSQGATLRAMGRDVAEIEAAVTLDRELFRWEELGAAADVRRSDERSAILKALGEATEPMGPRDLADELGKQQTAVRQILGRMVRAGEIVKTGRGLYALSSQSPRHNAHIGHSVIANSLGDCDRPESRSHDGAVVSLSDCDRVTKVTGPWADQL
jgi:hypothetical protein